MSESLIPASNQAAIDYLTDETTNYWTANAVAIGLSALQVTALQTKITAAQTALTNANAARAAAKNATQALDAAIMAMRRNGMALIATIKAKALAVGDPNIYTLANIPPPTSGSAVGPAPQPTNLTAEIDNLGGVVLRWKGSLANGTFFTVWRRLQGQTAFTQIGSVVSKTFVDTTIDPGTVSATYYVVAVRSGGASPASEPITVLFSAQMAA